MKIEETILNNFTLYYPIENLCTIDKILFLDIETTGFLSSSSYIYLIGCAYFEYDNWIIKQFFAQSKDEEQQIITEFLNFASNYEYLIHYNGNTFDLPFIEKRASIYSINSTLSSKNGLDIYKRIYTYKNLLKLEDCKLKTIEQYLNIKRDDRFNGGELIEVYKEYTSSHDYDLYRTLMLHNLDDMKGMLEVLPILSYYDIFNEQLLATKVLYNSYKDMDGFNKQELIINVKLPCSIPNPISFMGQGCHFKAENDNASLMVPIYEEELKYFYANYKDYYYLPLEDNALHKSIASFVDKDYREPAKASNCYTRKISKFLPMWTVLKQPFFKRNYESNDLFFELTDDIKKDRVLFSEYASHVINKIAFQK